MTAIVADVLQMSGIAGNRNGSTATDPAIEALDCAELAKRLRLPESWVRNHVRGRTPLSQQIPHLKFGRYVRFRWGSRELNAWIKAQENL